MAFEALAPYMAQNGRIFVNDFHMSKVQNVLWQSQEDGRANIHKSHKNCSFGVEEHKR